MGSSSCEEMKLFDAHCHLQDPRIRDMAPQVIKNAVNSEVVYMAVNGIQENDWQLVKDMGFTYPSIIPNFGLHPWFLSGKTPNWFESLKEFLNSTPTAAVGEIGLDNSSLVPPGNDFNDQLDVCKKQLELAKELNKPVTVHCLEAFDELLDMMSSIGPFPAGLILHSFAGTAEMVPKFAKLGAYFSFSGHFMNLEVEAARRVLRVIPLDRFLLETDSPDGLPKFKRVGEKTEFPEGTLNQPTYVRFVLSYVASLLDMPEKVLAKISYANSLRVFSFQGSKIAAYTRLS